MTAINTLIQFTELESYFSTRRLMAKDVVMPDLSEKGHKTVKLLGESPRIAH